MKTPLITREGYEKLKKEMDYLWREERPEVTKKVTWAAASAIAAKTPTTSTTKSACVKSTAGYAI
jgi:transcription elongation GreA/GreB family factor